MKILLIRFSSLGDCVLLCPLAAHLKANGADTVAVITKKAYADVFAAASGVDRVVAYDPKGGLTGLLRICEQYRGSGYRVIDAHNNWRSRVVSRRLGGAAGRFAKHYRERLALILFKRRVKLPSILDKYAALASAVGMPVAELAPGGIDVPDRYAAEADARMSGDGHSYVAMAPGARWPDKRWPIENYAELARRLVNVHGYRLLILGDDNDCAAAAVVADTVGDMCVDITARAGVIEGAAYMKQCLGFVGNDSGLAHLAEAVGLPVTVLYGPTVETFGYYPARQGSKSIEIDLPCRPCSRNGGRPCPKRTRQCLTAIGVDVVERAVLDMLSGGGPNRYVLTP